MNSDKISTQIEKTLGDGLDSIQIKDLRLRCVIGIYDWEREIQQDVLINVTLFTDLSRAGSSDKVEDTVNYKSVTKQIIAHTEQSSYFLVEALAQSIAELCLEEHAVREVEVAVEKPGALRYAKSVGVTIRRSKKFN